MAEQYNQKELKDKRAVLNFEQVYLTVTGKAKSNNDWLLENFVKRRLPLFDCEYNHNMKLTTF